MPIEGHGWELLIQRLEVQHNGTKSRTYGTYEAYLSGNAIVGLSGHVCESIGPGDNQQEDNGKRIKMGRYPLYTQYGSLYRSVGYSEDLQIPGALHMPGIRLAGTGERKHILIHPAHPPTLYLSSVGCFNLTGPVAGTQAMDFWDSRARVVDLIQNLRAFAPAAFAVEQNTRIQKASIVVDGEPY